MSSIHSSRFPLSLFLCGALLALNGCAGTPTETVRTEAAPTATAVTATHDADVHLAPADKALQRAIDAYVGKSRFDTALWSVQVNALKDGRVVYARNADKLLIPASNTKLFTAALALATLPSDHRIRTTLYATQAPSGSRLEGDLILYGRGDPSLGSGNDNQPPTHWADSMATRLVQQGVRQIQGDLIVDSTYFQGPPVGLGWEARDLQGWFAPQAAATSVQGNAFALRVSPQGQQCCTIHTTPSMPDVHVENQAQISKGAQWQDLGVYRPGGSHTVYVHGALQPGSQPRQFILAAPDPGRMAGELLREALVRHDIQLAGQVRSIHWPHASVVNAAARSHVMAEVTSPPIARLVRHMLKQSDNLYAQLLWQQVGAYAVARGQIKAPSQYSGFTEDFGRSAMNRWLRSIGIGADEADLEEGSGLSRKNIVTAAATQKLLAWVNTQPFAQQFHQALPVAAVDGTLRNRMAQTSAARNLHAKTGTLRHSYALSGYVKAQNGDDLSFAIYLDNYIRPGSPSPQSDIDAIAGMIAAYGAAHISE